MLFEHQRSYQWLFWSWVALCIAAIAVTAIIRISPIRAAICFPVTALFLLVSQVRSGVALNGMWVATYKRGSWQFGAACAANLAMLVFSTVFCVLAFGMPAN